MRRIAIGRDVYYWGFASEQYDYDVERDHVRVVPAEVHDFGRPGRILTFAPRVPTLDCSGWWDDRAGSVSITDEHVAKAIAIARRRDTDELTGAESLEAVGLDVEPPATTRLRSVAIALVNPVMLRKDFVLAWLALGCTQPSDELLDDWVICRSDELAASRAKLQALVDTIRTDDAPLRLRSAFEFLLARGRRVGLDLGLDLAAAGEHLAGCARLPARPFGIPPSHTWWTDG